MAEPEKLRLAEDLSRVGHRRLVPIVMRLRDGYYDEFSDTSPLATPETVLVNDLQEAGFKGWAVRVMNGEYDAGPAVSKAWAERQVHNHVHLGFDGDCARCILDSPAFQKENKTT